MNLHDNLKFNFNDSGQYLREFCVINLGNVNIYCMYFLYK